MSLFREFVISEPIHGALELCAMFWAWICLPTGGQSQSQHPAEYRQGCRLRVSEASLWAREIAVEHFSWSRRMCAVRFVARLDGELQAGIPAL